MVAAVTASAGVILVCVQASDITKGMDGGSEDPGLRSVASTTARAGAHHGARRRIALQTEAVHRRGQQHRLYSGGRECGNSGIVNLLKMIGRDSTHAGCQFRGSWSV